LLLKSIVIRFHTHPIHCTVHSFNMQTTLALLALAAVAYATPQGVTADITPSSPAPAGFSSSYNGQFEISIYKAGSKRDLETVCPPSFILMLHANVHQRQSTCGKAGYLTLTLAGGQLKDAVGRTGYIAANYQFQFDAPPQTGAIYTGGFSVGSNGSLALGGSAVFYECLSGSFYNLYDRSWAAQCSPILIGIVPCGSAGVATQKSDGQPQGTTVLPVTQISDGQPQGTSAVPVPVSEFTDGQPQVITAYPKPPVTQISDGQIQAPTATVTGKPVTQISDGQVQAPSATGKPVTQISDGQIQAPTSVAVVTQISDGQVQATGAANATKTPVPFTGSGNTVVASSFAALIIGAAAMLLL
jgi:cell wall mannoprotein